MGNWRRWWWTGVLVVGTGVNCSEGSDANDQEGDAGAGSAGAPNETTSGGSSGHDDENGGAAGADDDLIGGSGGAGELLGGAAGLPNVPGEGGRAVFDDVLISDDVIADDAVVVTKDCTDELGEVSLEVTRYCLLLASCSPNGADLGFGDCVWLKEGFVAHAPCAGEVTTCAELEQCESTTGIPPELAAQAQACIGDVLHITDVEDGMREEDCAARGLRCVDVLDPHANESNATCVPNGCDVDYAEAWGNACQGDDLVGRTNATTGGDDRPATVTVHCPDFGFSTCRKGRCVF